MKPRFPTMLTVIHQALKDTSGSLFATTVQRAQREIKPTKQELYPSFPSAFDMNAN